MTTKGLPKSVSALPKSARDIWKAIYDEVLSESDNTVSAISAAWKAVKEQYVMKKNGKWAALSEHEDSQNASINATGFINLSDTTEDENEPARAVMPDVLRKSSFNHAFYGELKFDDDWFNNVINNFHAGIVGRDLALNANHISSGGAYGWIRDLQYDGENFGIEFELTEKGRESIESGEMKYGSVEFMDNFVDKESEKEYGPTLTGCALTNTPFIPRQNAVSLLSEDVYASASTGNAELDVHTVIVLDNAVARVEFKNEDEPEAPEESVVEVTSLEDVEEIEEEDSLMDEELKTQLEEEQAKNQNLALELENMRKAARQGQVAALLATASNRVDESGNKIAPVVLTWAEDVLSGKPITVDGNTVALSEDAPVEYLFAAVSGLLNVVPGTVPTESSLANDDSQDNPADDEQTEEALSEEALNEFVAEVWKDAKATSSAALV